MGVSNPEHTNGCWFFYKRPEWSNEEEVRLVLPRHQGSTVKITPQWLTRLILGKSVSTHNEKLFAIGRFSEARVSPWLKLTTTS